MKQLLIIEDDKIDQMAFERFAKTPDFQFKFKMANSISEAKEFLKNHAFDAIVSDYYLGDGTAFEILEMDNKMPVIVVTGTGTEEIAVKALKKGAFDYLIKDVDGHYLKMLPITVENALTHYKNIQDIEHYHTNLEQLVESRTIELQKEIEVRMKTETTLRGSEEKFRTLANITPAGTYITDKNGNCTYANPRWLNMTGLSLEEALGMGWLKGLHQDDKDRIQKSWYKSQEARSTWELEYRFKKPNGETTWVRGVADPIFDHKKKLSGYIGVNLDITEHKKADEALKKSELKFKSLMQQSPFVVELYDIDGLQIEVNKAYEKLWGFPADTTVGKFNVLKSKEVEDSGLLSFIKRAFSGESVSVPEYKFDPKGETEAQGKGRVRWLNTRIYPLKNEFDNVSNIVIVHQDVTSRRQTESDLIKSEERFDLAMKASKDGLYDWNLISNKIYFSPAWKKMLGYEDKELPNEFSVWEKLTHPDDIKKSWDMLSQLLAKKRDRFELEFKMKHKLGHWVDILSRAEVEFDSEGNGIRVIGTHVDITKRKKTEEELRTALEKATESDRLKSAFLATMSHELRTPLNAIIGFSDIINEELSQEEIFKFCKNINSSGNHLLNIVEDLFDITLIETGKTQLHKTEEDLISVLKEIHEIVETELSNENKKNVSLKLHLPRGIKTFGLFTDVSKLKQILINLVKNAIKFTDDGHVKYGFKTDKSGEEQTLKFFVEDTGIGIPSNMQNIIFDVFRQVDDSYTRAYGGTGIGLSISKKLTELLGGKIWVESKVNKGSTFFFTIPLENKEFEAIKNAAEEPAIYKKLNKTILVVEDDPSSFEFLKTILEKLDVKIFKATNGAEAIKICKSKKEIDLVLMDINMPVLDGHKATKKIKKFRPDLPIIAQTAYAIAGDKEKSLEAGCDDYISKPIKRELLFELIEKHI